MSGKRRLRSSVDSNGSPIKKRKINCLLHQTVKDSSSSCKVKLCNIKGRRQRSVRKIKCSDVQVPKNNDKNKSSVSACNSLAQCQQQPRIKKGSKNKKGKCFENIYSTKSFQSDISEEKTTNEEFMLGSEAKHSSCTSEMKIKVAKNHNLNNLSSREMLLAQEFKNLGQLETVDVNINEININTDSSTSGNSSKSSRVASKALVEHDESSSESEWEEVEEAQEVMKEPVVPKEGVEIVLAVPKVWKRRQQKKKFDMAVFVRRQINRFKKDVQELLHKVHLLCLLARGMIVNRIVKGTLVEAIVFSVIPEEIHEVKSYNFSIATLQKMLLWFRGYFLYSFQYQSDCDLVDFENMITRYCETKVISCLLDYVLLFVVVCRVVGCKVRLCSSLYPLPLKPSDLLRKHSSKKKLEEEIVAEENNMPEQDIRSGKEVNIKKRNYSNNKLKNCKETSISSTSYSPVMNNKVPKSKNKGKNCKKIRTSLCKNNNIDMNADTSKEFITSNVKSDKYGQNQGKDKSFEVAEMRKSRKLSNSESTVMKSKGKEVCKIDSYKLRKREYVKKLYKDTSSDDETKDSDSDFDNCESFNPQVQKTVHSKKSPIFVSSDDNSAGKSKNSKTSAFDNGNTVKIKHWIEIFCPDENRWISVDCVNNIFDEPHIIEQCVAKPLMYVLTFDNNGRVKDVTKRYASDWMTSTQKDRVDGTWWEETLRPFKPLPDETDRNEDLQIEVMLMEKPLPTTISEFKNHPLYALKRHLLKFEAIYPPDAPPLGYIRGEPVYARECVHTLHSRETWMKEARVVRIGEQPYKIVKGRPKWDRSVGELKRDIQLEVFGKWQTEEYIPPVAHDGKVPRNEYGNIELFQPSMLPKGTVHLQLPALNRIAKKLGIDCAPALVGFDGHGGGVHPVFDGWVVCEEYSDTLQAAWEEEQENARRRAEEKREKRVYGNWKKLIKGILIRERLQVKYNVGTSK